MSVPVESIETSWEHDVAEHLRPEQDEGRLESMGRRPLVVRATLLFNNTILPAAGDSWVNRGPLFPDQFVEYQKNCADRTTGPLIHPIFGQYFAKIISYSDTISASQRDGAKVTVTWKRTIEDEDDDEDLFSSIENMPSVLTAAAQLDAAKLSLPVATQMEDPDNLVETFLSAVSRANNVVDQASLASRQDGAVFDRVLYRAEALGGAIERLKDARTWPAKNCISRLTEMCRSQQGKLLAKGGLRSVYINPSSQTLTTLALRLKNSVAELLELNPSLTGAAFVPQRIPVAYYKKA